MERVREHIAKSRAHTDVSLGAERASTDSTLELATRSAQRLQDDRIERDRISADDRLVKFRDRADGMRALERSVAPEPGSAVAIEREVADQNIRAEREDTDALLERERHRADDVVETERHAHATHATQLVARRQETDEQLDMERSNADSAVTELAETRSALAHAQGGPSSRGDVLAMVTHDLRSPLSIIAVSARSLAEVTKDAAVLEVADDVILAAARMERLLTDLLDTARIESGTLRIKKAPQELGSFLAEVHRFYRPLFESRGMTFSVQPPTNALVVSLDHDRIVQVLSNLLGNAMKFTPVEGTVDLRVVQRDGDIEFVLRDSGPGISPEDLPHVFKRFCQVASDTRRGLGLGLHICQKIVEAHGGRIWAESELGKGATFRFTLPAR
jgi:signal transduction histidine kinase